MNPTHTPETSPRTAADRNPAKLCENRFREMTQRMDEIDARCRDIERLAGKRIGELMLDIARSERSEEERFDELRNIVNETVERRFRELETRKIELEEAYAAIFRTRSWRMTAPYRALGDLVRGAWQGFKNILKPFAAFVLRSILRFPLLKKGMLLFVRPFPRLKARLERFALARGILVEQPRDATAPTPQVHQRAMNDDAALRTEEIHARLKQEINRPPEEE